MTSSRWTLILILNACCIANVAFGTAEKPSIANRDMRYWKVKDALLIVPQKTA
ncbi:hypothetical protein BofuT4_uP023720.1 [Botrytis cinerea T4]|uniref:Uncharacterized protein n=1 Tax=Botryotinia fuckeliana (strain T4) TaxID=999810 RepID=G2YH70_BOTF4|nr:hypothetical protein BofuT4_uP023720.1 [Botrytis cinerea T4]